MYLVFSKKVCFLLPICLPCVICGSLWVVCNEDKCCVVMQHAADIRVAWLVHLECLNSHILRAYCNLNQNKQTWLLYLGDAQIKRVKKILLPSGSPLTGGFIWSLGTKRGQQRGTGYKHFIFIYCFVQIIRGSLGAKPGMPTGKCIRLRNRVNQVQPGN